MRGRWGSERRQARTSFFEKKEAKKLLLTGGFGAAIATARN
jgi:hypothetical protein